MRSTEVLWISRSEIMQLFPINSIKNKLVNFVVQSFDYFLRNFFAQNSEFFGWKTFCNRFVIEFYYRSDFSRIVFELWNISLDFHYYSSNWNHIEIGYTNVTKDQWSSHVQKCGSISFIVFFLCLQNDIIFERINIAFWQWFEEEKKVCI